MRVAVLTDIHANLPAFEAVLEEAGRAGVEEIWCLGDLVGYGADPDACIDLARSRCDLCLAGNHDLAVLGDLEIAQFSETAAAAVRWTRSNIAAASLEFLRNLTPHDRRQRIGLFHASPRNPIWEYVLSVEAAEECMDAHGDEIALIGHSHVALYFARPDHGRRGDTRGAQAEPGASLDLHHGEWLINPGSVGQPRDGDPRAAWLELDTDEMSARFRRSEYDLDRAAAAILAAGLPERLAERLYSGQ